MSEDLKEIEEALNKKEAPAKKKQQQKKASSPKSKYYLDEISVKVVKMRDDAILPAYAHEGDACMDLRANNIISVMDANGNVRPVDDFSSIMLMKGWVVKFGTGISLDLPDGWSADILIRSGISSNEGLVLMNGKGEVDTTYNGELIVAIGKINGKPTVIQKNERIAQFKPMRQTKMNLEVVEAFEHDEDNERGADGLGSSGLK